MTTPHNKKRDNKTNDRPQQQTMGTTPPVEGYTADNDGNIKQTTHLSTEPQTGRGTHQQSITHFIPNKPKNLNKTPDFIKSKYTLADYVGGAAKEAVLSRESTAVTDLIDKKQQQKTNQHINTALNGRTFYEVATSDPDYLSLVTPQNWKPAKQGKLSDKEKIMAFDTLATNLDINSINYLNYLQKADLYNKTYPAEQRHKNIKNGQQMFINGAVASAIGGLGMGLNAETITKALGTGLALYIIFPEFRDAVHRVTTPFKNATEEELAKKTNPDYGIAGKMKDRAERQGKDLNGIWQKLYNKKFERIHGHPPLTEAVAAQTYIGLSLSAYNALRVQGNDPEFVIKEFKAYINELMHDCEKSGLSTEAVNTNIRFYVGRYIKERPELAAVFDETAYGAIRPTDDKKLWFETVGKSKTTWPGTLSLANGQVITTGNPVIRLPSSPNDHYTKLAEAMRVDIELHTPNHKNSMDDFAGCVLGYGSAYAHRNNPEFINAQQGRYGTNIAIGYSAIKAMQQDGLDDETIMSVYTAAYNTAVQEVLEHKPELNKMWDEKFGDNWKEGMARFIHNPVNSTEAQHIYDVFSNLIPKREAPSKTREMGKAIGSAGVKAIQPGAAGGNKYGPNPPGKGPDDTLFTNDGPTSTGAGGRVDTYAGDNTDTRTDTVDADAPREDPGQKEAVLNRNSATARGRRIDQNTTDYKGQSRLDADTKRQQDKIEGENRYDNNSYVMRERRRRAAFLNRGSNLEKDARERLGRLHRMGVSKEALERAAERLDNEFIDTPSEVSEMSNALEKFGHTRPSRRDSEKTRHMPDLNF